MFNKEEQVQRSHQNAQRWGLVLMCHSCFSFFQKVRLVQEDVGKKAPTIQCRHFILGHPKQKNKTLVQNLVITIKNINNSICSDIKATRRIGQKEQQQEEGSGYISFNVCFLVNRLLSKQGRVSWSAGKNKSKIKRHV